MNGKYIIFERNGLEYPVLFPNHFIQHNEVKAMGDPVSAGFFNLFTHIDGYSIGVTVNGESVSLKLKYRSEDAELIRRQFTN
jgi:hypothetical protein